MIPVTNPATAALLQSQQALRDYMQSPDYLKSVDSAEEEESGGRKVPKGEERKKDGEPHEGTAGGNKKKGDKKGDKKRDRKSDKKRSPKK